MSKKNLIPDLIMGERASVHSTDPSVTADKIAEAIKNLEYWEPQKQAGRFHSKATSYTINDVHLVAQASTPMRAAAGYSNSLNIEFSYYGVCRSAVDGVNYEWAPNQQAVFFPEITGRGGPSDTRSIVMAQFDKTRLIETTQSMLGADNTVRANLDLSDTRLVSLQYGRINFDQMFQNLWRYVDSIDANDQVLEMIGIDDLFYRHASLLLHPRLFFRQATDVPNNVHNARDALDRVCDAMKDMTRKPFTMTELETLSGMSARNLQYQFKSRFACSPMAWQRRERLMTARDCLMADTAPITIIELSRRLGFSSPSNFIAYYARQFGETPAQTRGKHYRSR